MNLMQRRPVALAFLAMLVGCGGSSGPPPFSLTGDWSQVERFSGVSLVLTLTEQNGSVGGTGTYTLELGSPGTLQVNGTDDGSTIALNLLYDTGGTAVFTGAFIDANDFSGTWTTNGASTAVAFKRN